MDPFWLFGVYLKKTEIFALMKFIFLVFWIFWRSEKIFLYFV